MRIVSYVQQQARRVGVVRDDGIVDVTAVAGSVRALLADGRLDAVAEAAERARGPIALADVILDLPVPNPGKIFCVGVNYQDRNAEYKDGSEAPKHPSLFMRTPLSFVPHGGKLVRPRESANSTTRAKSWW